VNSITKTAPVYLSMNFSHWGTARSVLDGQLELLTKHLWGTQGNPGERS